MARFIFAPELNDRVLKRGGRLVGCLASLFYARLPPNKILLIAQFAYSFPQSIKGCLSAVGKMEFVQDAAYIFRNRPFVHDQVGGDFLVAESAGDQANGIQFALQQAGPRYSATRMDG